ncbi:MAG: hypothetical protein M1835_007022 [Candelina submexicana]|nr:MAG: hypothetical protein M1835_007022 [Candelina submexicana]
MVLSKKKAAGWAARAPRDNGVKEDEAVFPFLKLPPELRNTIYRYLLVTPRPIDMSSATWRVRDVGVAILRVSRQTNIESERILYSENRFFFVISDAIPLPLRTDHGTLRRVGKSGVGKTRFEGRIYQHVLHRIEHMTIHLQHCTLLDHFINLKCKCTNLTNNFFDLAAAVSGQESMLKDLRIHITESASDATFSSLAVLQRWKDCHLQLTVVGLRSIDPMPNLEFDGDISPATAKWAKDWVYDRSASIKGIMKSLETLY